MSGSVQAGYGHLTEGMLKALRPILRGRTVVDLGCGNGAFLPAFLRLGAKRVVGVDIRHLPRCPDGCEFLLGAYTQVAKSLGRVDVAFVSWPPSRPVEGLVDILRTARRVVYLGVNNASFACGSEDLWEHLNTRRVMREVQHDANDLLVYGQKCSAPRAFTREEAAPNAAAGLRRYLAGGAVTGVVRNPRGEIVGTGEPQPSAGFGLVYPPPGEKVAR